MRILFSLIFLILILNAKSQHRAAHIQYEHKWSAYIFIESIDEPIQALTARSVWHTIKNEKYAILYMSDVEAKSDIKGKLNNKDEGDTLLFDLKNLKVYFIKEKKSYSFTQRKFPIGNNNKFILKDTFVECNSSTPINASPLPIFLAPGYGITTLKAHDYSFHFLSATPIEINLEAIFERVKHFRFLPGSPPILTQ